MDKDKEDKLRAYIADNRAQIKNHQSEYSRLAKMGSETYAERIVEQVLGETVKNNLENLLAIFPELRDTPTSTKSS